MATAYAAIANGGLLRAPRIVESVGGAAGARAARACGSSAQAVSAELRRMLEGVLLPGGTASEIQIPGYELAGKTGTANKVVNGTYSQTTTSPRSSASRRRSDPKVEAIVVVDPPSTGYDLRHRGRGAGVEADHGVRAAVPRGSRRS